MAKKSSEPVILPEKYYHTYFCELLEFVQKHSGHLLDEPDQVFLNDFYSLSEDAQCLFIRLSNRKGPYYRIAKLNYHEIANLDNAKTELLQLGFLTKEVPNDPVLYKQFTKVELAKVYPDQKLKKLSKEEILITLYEYDDPETLLAAHEVVCVDRQDEVEFFKLLFFGRYKQQMTEFVIRDVGHVQLQDLDEAQFKPWFQDREEALAVFELSKLSSLVRRAMQSIETLDVHLALDQVDWNQYLISPKAQWVGERVFHQLGPQLEREGFLQEAIVYYEMSRKHPARERIVRLLDKLDKRDLAEELATEILNDHWNATEYLFAKDFLNRPNIRINRSTTAKMKSSKAITVVQNPEIHVEQQALEYFYELGYDGVHSENHLWKSLYGALFWELLFDQSHGDYHHPLQRGASDLYTDQFYLKRQNQINERLDKLRDVKIMTTSLEEIFDQKYGLANSMIYWYDGLKEHLQEMVDRLPIPGIHKVMTEMSKNIKDNSTGFPDLFIWKEDEYQFYEIKSPNDHLSSQQLFWLNFMQDQGIKADLLRVQFS